MILHLKIVDFCTAMWAEQQTEETDCVNIRASLLLQSVIYLSLTDWQMPNNAKDLLHEYEYVNISEIEKPFQNNGIK